MLAPTAVRERDRAGDLPVRDVPATQPSPRQRAADAPAFDQLVLDLPLPPTQGDVRATAGSTPRTTAAAAVAQQASIWARPSPAARAVMAFHAAFDLPRRACPSADIDADLVELRIRLLIEEVGEFATAARVGDLVALADALGDIVYVAYGAAVSYGVDLDAVLAEVHRANMSKLDAFGRPILRDDGKVLKSDRYRPPDVASVIYHQAPLPLA